MIDIPELKPCPFCGGTDIWPTPHRNPFGLVCGGCGSEGPPESYVDPDEAITAWNTRTPPQVKPLVWSDECRKNSFPDRWQAEMPCGAGDYTVAGSTRKNEWRWYRNGRDVVGFYDQEPTTIEAAKAAAQADYTRRILDALA